MLVANVSTAMSGRAPSNEVWHHDQGINGLVRVVDAAGAALLVGAAMPGFLVTAKLAPAPALPTSFGDLNISTKGWLDAAYDLDTYSAHDDGVYVGLPRHNPAGSIGGLRPPPLLAVVGPVKEDGGNMFALVETADTTTGTFLPPNDWQLVGAASLPPRQRQKGGGSGKRALGCNRVRVHQASKRAAFSCFGGGYGNDVVGFVDLSVPESPTMLGTVTFVTEQPTGMLLVGDALFVAGELDIMVFDMRANATTPTTTTTPTPASQTGSGSGVGVPPTVATCGAACMVSDVGYIM